MEARLKIGGGTRKSKGLLRRRKNAMDACTNRSVDNIEKYKVAKNTAKPAVSVAKGRAYEDLYQHLSTKEGEDIYRMARVREKDNGLQPS